MSETKPTIQLVRTKNCGIGEINWLSSAKSPLEALQTLHSVLYRGITWPPLPDHSGSRTGVRFPFLIFTGVVPLEAQRERKNYGQNFADYITENNLGGVVTVPAARKNWTGNFIQIWVWEPDYDKLWALLGPAPEFVIKGEGNGVVETADRGVEVQPVGDRLTPREAEESCSEARG